MVDYAMRLIVRMIANDGDVLVSNGGVLILRPFARQRFMLPWNPVARQMLKRSIPWWKLSRWVIPSIPHAHLIVIHSYLMHSRPMPWHSTNWFTPTTALRQPFFCLRTVLPSIYSYGVMYRVLEGFCYPNSPLNKSSLDPLRLWVNVDVAKVLLLF